MFPRSLLLVGLILAAVATSPLQAQAPVLQSPSNLFAFARDWIAKAADNICGLKDLAQLSNPVHVDFQALLDATPEMKKIRDEGIDRASPEGIRLTTAATDRVTKSCESVRSAQGYCSVWKEIRHKDGRVLTDITDRVKSQL